MARPAKKSRPRGSIENRGNSLRVEVYAGTDLVTGKRLYLTESTTDEREAERIRTRLQAQVDQQRNARTKATFGLAIDVSANHRRAGRAESERPRPRGR